MRIKPASLSVLAGAYLYKGVVCAENVLGEAASVLDHLAGAWAV